MNQFIRTVRTTKEAYNKLAQDEVGVMGVQSSHLLVVGFHIYEYNV